MAVHKLLGILFSAYDEERKEVVALKIEKADKSKRILQIEYQILKNLQCKLMITNKALTHICPVYGFIENEQFGSCNFIVMKMLGKT